MIIIASATITALFGIATFITTETLLRKFDKDWKVESSEFDEWSL